jgi:hypothetical protein
MSLHDDVFVTVCNKHIIMQGHTFLLYRWDYATNTKGKYSVCNKHIIMQGHTFLLYRWDYATNTKGKYSVCNKYIIMQGHTVGTETLIKSGWVKLVPWAQTSPLCKMWLITSDVLFLGDSLLPRSMFCCFWDFEFCFI